MQCCTLSHPLTFSELRFLQSPWLSAAPGTRYPLSSPRTREPFFQMIRLTQVRHWIQVRLALTVRQKGKKIKIYSLVAKVLTLYALGSYVGAGLYPDCSTSLPAPCFWLGKSNQGWPKALGPCSHMGDMEEAPGSCLQISLPPAREPMDGKSSPFSSLW